MSTKNAIGATPPASDWIDPDDAPELTEAFFADAEHFKGDTFVKRGRGRPPSGNAKELVSVRLDRDVLAKLREAGPGWQSRVNTMLRTAVGLDGKTVIAAEAVGLRSASPSKAGAKGKTIHDQVRRVLSDGGYTVQGAHGGAK